MNAESSRKAILKRVQKALKRDNGSPDTLNFDNVDSQKLTSTFERLAQARAAPNPVGFNGTETQEKWVDVFIEKAQQSNTPVERIDSIEDVVSSMKISLSQQSNNRIPLYVQQLDAFKKLAWPESDIEITDDYTQVEQWGLVKAECAIAETGSVVLMSGAEHAIAAGFLPDNLVVLVEQDRIVMGLEDIWPVLDKKRADLGLKQNPRAINIITGPSRTADVEQVVQLGAHGPRTLKVLLLSASI